MRRLSPVRALKVFDSLLADGQDLPAGVDGETNVDALFVGAIEGATSERPAYGHLGSRKMPLTVYSVEAAEPWSLQSSIP
jgi:hypothetical protein